MLSLRKRKATGPPPGALDKSKVVRRDPRTCAEHECEDILIKLNISWEVLKPIIHKDTWRIRAVRLPLLHDVDILSSDVQINDARIDAYLVQSRGLDRIVRCTGCRNGRGPFVLKNCRWLMVDNKPVKKGTCGAHIWNSEGKKCEHHENHDEAKSTSEDQLETLSRMNKAELHPLIDHTNGFTPSAVGSLPIGYEAIEGSSLLMPKGTSDSDLATILEDILLAIRIRNEFEPVFESDLVVQDPIILKKTLYDRGMVSGLDWSKQDQKDYEAYNAEIDQEQNASGYPTTGGKGLGYSQYSLTIGTTPSENSNDTDDEESIDQEYNALGYPTTGGKGPEYTRYSLTAGTTNSGKTTDTADEESIPEE